MREQRRAFALGFVLADGFFPRTRLARDSSSRRPPQTCGLAHPGWRPTLAKTCTLMGGLWNAVLEKAQLSVAMTLRRDCDMCWNWIPRVVSFRRSAWSAILPHSPWILGGKVYPLPASGQWIDLTLCSLGGSFFSGDPKRVLRYALVGGLIFFWGVVSTRYNCWGSPPFHHQTHRCSANLLWMDEIQKSHHFETMVETIVCWYVRWGIDSFQGFLGGSKWISQPSTVAPPLFSEGANRRLQAPARCPPWAAR